MFYELLKGAPKEEEVHWHQEVHEQPRVANQWGAFNYLLEAPPPAHRQRGRRGRDALGADLPAEPRAPGGSSGWGWSGRCWRWWCRRTARPLLPFLVAFVLIAVSAMLVGDVPRYRYPVDPLMYVMAAGGLLGAVSLSDRILSRLTVLAHASAPSLTPHPPTP